MQLVINSYGASLRKEGDRFLIQAGEKNLSVSAHKVQSILITTGAHLSTDIIELASMHNIEVEKVSGRWKRWVEKVSGTLNGR